MIVADTGPLIRVCELAAPSLLDPFRPVFVPPLVAHECSLRGINLDEFGVSVSEEGIGGDAEERVGRTVRAGIIQAADAQAIALTLATDAEWLLCDDTRARFIAEGFHLEVHGTIGLILANVRLKCLTASAAKHYLGQLPSTSLWVSSRVLTEAQQMLDSIEKSGQ